MTANTILKRLLDAGMQFTEMSQSSAEKLVNEFVKNGQLRRKDAEKTVQQLVERGRSSTEQLFSAVQTEVAKQLGRFADRIDDLEDRIEDLAESLGLAAKANQDASPSAPVTASSVGAPAEQAAKAATPAKKAPAKKAPAKKAPAKQAPAKQAPGTSSGVAKVATKKAAKR
jgi:polyhydroxyalkanoate synthesis regulator phasin